MPVSELLHITVEVNPDGLMSASELRSLAAEVKAQADNLMAIYWYCDRMAWARGLRERGNIDRALEHEASADKYYRQLPAAWKW